MATALVVILAAGATAAASGGGWTLEKSPNTGGNDKNYLVSVAIAPKGAAFAVGYFDIPTRRVLIERWDGTAWKVQKSPNNPRNDWLYGVAATSPSNAWAVGHIGHTNVQTLVEHWNGKAWTIQRSPSPGGHNESRLAYVAATSGTNAWAVGRYSKGAAVQPLIEHWDGKAWHVQSSPNPGTNGQLFGVATARTSTTNAWAVGNYSTSTATQTLVEHWDGTAWTVQQSPNPTGSSDSHLFRVTATSATNAWAVGHYNNGTADQTLIEHWNGKTWTVQQSPDPGGPTHANYLLGVAAISPTNAWAVGFYQKGTALHTLIEHWNGKTWTVQQSPNPGGPTHANRLWDVAATAAWPGRGSAALRAWAVGYYGNGSTDRNLVARCC